MTVEELRKKFPRIYSKDGMGRLTIGEIALRIAAALGANASKEAVEEIACDIIDRDFLFGAFGHCWTDRDRDLLQDIRGVIIAAYRAGKGTLKGEVEGNDGN